MNLFKKWFQKMCREAWENASEDKLLPSNSNIVGKDVVASQSIDSNGIRFTIYKADGGHVVETSTYDKHHDRQTNLYIISQDQNFGDRIAHILTFEAIKR
jgi:hypothetical protein